MAKKSTAIQLTTKQVQARLRQFCDKSFAVLTEVADGTGASHSRWADALGMCIWPSRGLELHGYEIKVSRADWLKELKNPEKAEAVCKFCDRWWIVCGASGIVRDGELPQTWGLIEPTNNSLRTVVKAPQLTPIPVDRHFLAAIFRRAAEQSVDAETLNATRKEGYESGVEYAKRHPQMDWDRREYDLLKESVSEFEQTSGIKIESYIGKRIGEAVNAVMRGEHKRDEEGLNRIQQLCRDTIQQIEKIKTNSAIVGSV